MPVTTDIQQQVYDLLSRASNISFVTADGGSESGIGLTPGQKVTAEVLTTLGNRAQVRVGSERLNLDLPTPVKVGQTLEMTYLSAAPRPTFAIARQGGATPPPVSLSDASRLLSLLVSDEKITEPAVRSSLQSIGEILRRSPGDSGVLANLLDEVLTYSANRRETAAPLLRTDDPSGRTVPGQANATTRGTFQNSSDLSRLSSFESNASLILKNIAQNSRFALLEAANQPVAPLPFLPGEEVNATVVGTLPGGRVVLQVAGSTFELPLPKAAQQGDILRLTYISSDPKPVFAIPRPQPDSAPALLSEAGRWLSVLEHAPGGVTEQQANVLERLNTVLKYLPANSPAFTAIKDEPALYHPTARAAASQAAAGEAAPAAVAPQQSAAAPGNGILLSDDMARLLQAVIKGNRLALLEALNQQTMPTGLAAGQQVKGEVLEALGGGRFMVQVAGQALEFTMPKGIRRGEFVQLFFITEEPRSTFLMARFGRSGDSQVSDAARWLGGFLGSAGERISTGGLFNILRTLLSAPPSDASQVSATLQRGLRESGMFYESHLARWFGGEYPLEELLKEPQGRLSPRLSEGVLVKPGIPIMEEHPPSPVRNGAPDLLESIFKRPGSSAHHEGIIDQSTAPIVKEQLSSLQNGQLMFRGDLFPGQRFEWTVAEREGQRNKAGERERTWGSTMNLNLPHLGPVGVRLRLDGTRISMDIIAEKSDTAPLLETGKGALADQLEAAGLSPAEIVIKNAAA